MERSTLGVVVVYLVQMEGEVSIKELAGTIQTKLCSGKKEITRLELKNAVTAARKRGLLSMRYDESNVERFAIKSIKWANPPEVAHLKTLLPILLKTPEAEEISNILKDMDVNDKEHTKGRQMDIRDYVSYTLTFKNVLPVLGGEPGMLPEELVGDDDEAKGCILRRINKDVWIPLNFWLRAALRLKLRMKNVAESRVQYLYITDCFIHNATTQKVQIVAPAGGGFIQHEALSPGYLFKTKISFPTTGFGITEKEFIDCVVDEFRIGARHKDYGLCQKVEAVKI